MEETMGRREAFLTRVREAATSPVDGIYHVPVQTPEEPGRSASGVSLPDRFAVSAVAAGIVVSRIATPSMAADAVAAILQAHSIAAAATWSGEFVSDYGLSKLSERYGVELTPWKTGESENERKERAFQMACGITGADYAIAETGSLVVVASPSQGRSVSLLGEVHICIVRASKILSDLYDLPGRLAADFPDGMPSNVTVITGPSKTADIELQIVVGVHGPRHVHAILVDEA